jgi:hypothetical protein
LKRGRRLTRLEKSCVLKQGFDPAEYEYAYKISDSYFKIRHKKNKTEVTIDIYRRSKSKWEY